MKQTRFIFTASPALAAPPTPTPNPLCHLAEGDDCALFEPRADETQQQYPPLPADSPLRAADVAPQSVGGLNLYLGDLHNHTGYSDGVGTPEQAFATAKSRGLDFMAVTEHGFMLTPTEWQNLKDQADAATDDGNFVALAGYEFTHAKGHINVFNSTTLVHRNQPEFAALDSFYEWLVNHPTAIGQFNHPFQSQDWNFNDFAYHPLADHKMIAQELTTAPDFFIAMNGGWHLGTLKNRDYHTDEWGLGPLMGVAAAELTRAGIYEALEARRTFFVSPNDAGLKVVLRANGAWMGSALPPTSQINFTINAFDSNPSGYPLRLALYDNGARVASTTKSSASSYTWTPTISAKQGHYYYAEAYYTNWSYPVPAYSSPVWVERPPLAVPQPPALAPVGHPVTLDGRQSSDPDGDALAYRWTQESNTGTPFEVSQANRFAGTAIVTPTVAGQTSFRLTVSDPGGLSHSALTVVSATEQPFLQIEARGPNTSPPGQPITYSLIVTNIGISTANNVVITGQVPAGASYLSGGNLQSDGIILWDVPTLAANNGSAAVQFSVSADSGIALTSYSAGCPDCIAAQGDKAIFTNGSSVYLPIIAKNH